MTAGSVTPRDDEVDGPTPGKTYLLGRLGRLAPGDDGGPASVASGVGSSTRPRYVVATATGEAVGHARRPPGGRVDPILEEVVISTERTDGSGTGSASGSGRGQGNAASVAAIAQFIDDFVPEDDVLVTARSRGDEIGYQAVSPATGALLRWLAAMVEARTVAEVGTGVGVSGLWLLRGMTSDGVLTTVDDEAENTRAARLAFADAGVATQRTRLITGRPLEVLGRLADGGYDLVFLNGAAHETGQYVEEAVRLLRPGGLVVVADALSEGRVPDPAQRDSSTVAMRTLVSGMADDERVRPLLLPVGDGVLVLQALPGPGPATNPEPPSATATTSNGS